MDLPSSVISLNRVIEGSVQSAVSSVYLDTATKVTNIIMRQTSYINKHHKVTNVTIDKPHNATNVICVGVSLMTFVAVPLPSAIHNITKQSYRWLSLYIRQ